MRLTNNDSGSGPASLLSDKSRKVRLGQFSMKPGNSKLRLLKFPISGGMECCRKLLLRSKNERRDKLPIEGGIGPSRLFPLRLRSVRLGNEAKSRLSKLPVRPAFGKLIREIGPPFVVQSSPAHEQRLVMLLRDHEARYGDGDDKVFFHLTNACAACACVVVVEEFVWRGKRVRTKMCTKEMDLVLYLFMAELLLGLVCFLVEANSVYCH
ncbi:Arf-GAP with GTPase [Striga asiatica]|uniref:Arf-GAP with GTPase n=1 Tax=Striga asiatica TaxID=4170 RepID=A0A5A7QAV9_STRAF|nr:Arf-GAP with GTPase [Striga asiatica]